MSSYVTEASFVTSISRTCSFQLFRLVSDRQASAVEGLRPAVSGIVANTVCRPSSESFGDGSADARAGPRNSPFLI